MSMIVWYIRRLIYITVVAGMTPKVVQKYQKFENVVFGITKNSKNQILNKCTIKVKMRVSMLKISLYTKII